MSAARLYTPEILALAMELADWPSQETLPLRGEARSRACGSTLTMDLAVGEDGCVETLGMRVRACAIGQASAAIFARHAAGQDAHSLQLVLDRLEAWLEDEGPAPDWPRLSLLMDAKDYPGRHGAILLPWQAARAALSPAQDLHEGSEGHCAAARVCAVTSRAIGGVERFAHR